jgi:hypothetical protein
MTPLDQLTNDQVLALAKYACLFGRNWKRHLRFNWENSWDCECWAIQIRNKIGPTGLAHITTRHLVDRVEAIRRAEGLL